MNRYFTDLEPPERGLVSYDREIHWSVLLEDARHMRGLAGGLHLSADNMALLVAVNNLIALIEQRGTR